MLRSGAGTQTQTGCHGARPSQQKSFPFVDISLIILHEHLDYPLRCAERPEQSGTEAHKLEADQADVRREGRNICAPPAASHSSRLTSLSPRSSTTLYPIALLSRLPRRPLLTRERAETVQDPSFNRRSLSLGLRSYRLLHSPVCPCQAKRGAHMPVQSSNAKRVSLLRPSRFHG